MISVRDISLKVDEKVLRTILQVNRRRIRIVVDKSPTKIFLLVAREKQNLNTSSISKKFLKRQYQLYSKFVNKVLLP